jgi:uncharacterized protein (TIGR02147 family)
MPELFEFDDFREFLRDYQAFRQTKHNWFSLRYMASKIEMDPGYFIKMVQGKVQLSERYIKPLCQFLGLNEKQAQYFQELVHFSRAKTQKEIRESYQRILTLKDLNFHTVSFNQFEYFTHPKYASIRALSEILDFREDYELLGKTLSPPISPKNARDSVELLEKIGMLKRDPSGRWMPSQQFVSSGNNWNATAICAYQQEMFKLALDSFDRHPKDTRDMSTLTITLKQKDLPELKERIARFRKEISQWVGEQSNEDTVVQLNIQAFPLSQPGAAT